jgi:hypothetical protein
MNALVDSGVGHLDASLQWSEAQLVQNPHHSLRVREVELREKKNLERTGLFVAASTVLQLRLRTTI